MDENVNKLTRKEYMREYMKLKREKAKVEALKEELEDYAKYPNKAALAVAIARADRAKRYAKMFPYMIRGDDVKFQTVDWQYFNEGLPAVKKSVGIKGCE